MTEWRLLDLEYEDPHMNLAVEEAITRRVGEGSVPDTVRLWRNDNAVIIGCFQSAALEVDFGVAQKLGVKIVRRFTGGGAVYHDLANLNYSVILRQDSNSPIIDLATVFRELSQGAIAGLRNLGVPAEFKPINDIVIGERKVSGGAGCIRWGSILHHGCILVGTELEVLGRVLKVPAEKLSDKHVKSIPKRVITLKEALGMSIEMGEVKKALQHGIEQYHKVTLVPDSLNPEEESLASELYNEKYSRPEWNLKP